MHACTHTYVCIYIYNYMCIYVYLDAQCVDIYESNVYRYFIDKRYQAYYCYNSALILFGNAGSLTLKGYNMPRRKAIAQDYHLFDAIEVFRTGERSTVVGFACEHNGLMMHTNTGAGTLLSFMQGVRLAEPATDRIRWLVLCSIVNRGKHYRYAEDLHLIKRAEKNKPIRVFKSEADKVINSD